MSENELPQSASQTAPSEMGPLAVRKSFPFARGSLLEGAGAA